MGRIAKPKPETVYLTAATLAAMASISIQRLSQMRSEAFPPPVNEHGEYPAIAAGAWMRAYAIRKARADYRPGAEAGESRLDVKLDSERQLARKNAALADKTEIEIGVRRGELMEAVDVEATWSEILMRVKTRLMQIPSVAAPLLIAENDQHTITEIIDDLVRDALTELSSPPVVEEVS